MMYGILREAQNPILWTRVNPLAVGEGAIYLYETLVWQIIADQIMVAHSFALKGSNWHAGGYSPKASFLFLSI